MNQQMAGLPVVVIGAGPVGLATAAHLLENGLTPLVLEAGGQVGAAVTAWGHTRVFSPWQYNIDAAARRLLEPTGWVSPRPTALPTGAELVAEYLKPLAAQLGELVHTGVKVTAVTRDGLDKTRTDGRDSTPFMVRTITADGTIEDVRARAVIDASGTWDTPNPLGAGGLPAPGEEIARAQGFITAPLPDVTGRGRASFANKHTVVVGSGHSAANTLIALGELVKDAPDTKISWIVRNASATNLYGGQDKDGLPARGMLGTRLRKLVDTGIVELHQGFTITSFTPGTHQVNVVGRTAEGETVLEADLVVPAAGFRPDLTILSEVRLDLDPAVEAPTRLGPLIDPEHHSCGTVPAHGATVLAHPEKDFYLVGMKSYGRAPTFLMATGYEQVRSIAAALAGNDEAANQVELNLPETGVCSADTDTSCDTPIMSGEKPTGEGVQAAGSSCCAAAPEPVLIGISTGLAHGRAGHEHN
ncbi:NADPH-dependent 2,4-dienoyl-CoA reductase/sulfur reductase-like enzyme [Psychromicrobium silvestre]|uniref:NADPH-dependent 2,4-dienoyl-CoA reductase/sulfur reductase-like enzyme n=1 Tax=Psychromicrobium silvestre TaxID=1645614 RepID=A0A7Y9S8E4_9MICC|nr:FAD-dependent oxidoreductase [Psychromicrobium silvestre]NYE95886.1 NADPH-dependent 2,4-dienoyl-CoA reductase/sulfur reductase-like enzyme [Psychromicrobium silvestre]